MPSAPQAPGTPRTVDVTCAPRAWSAWDHGPAHPKHRVYPGPWTLRTLSAWSIQDCGHPVHPECMVHPGPWTPRTPNTWSARTVDTECTPSAGSPQDHGCRVHPERLSGPSGTVDTTHTALGGICSWFPVPSPEHARQHGNVPPPRPPHPRPLPSWTPPLRPSGARTSPTRIRHPGPASSGKGSSPRELPQDGGQEPGTGRQSRQSLGDLTSSFYGEIKHRPGHWVTTGAKLHSQTPEPVLSRIGSWIQPFLLRCLRPGGWLRGGTEGLAAGTVASLGGLTLQRELRGSGARVTTPRPHNSGGSVRKA